MEPCDYFKGRPLNPVRSRDIYSPETLRKDKEESQRRKLKEVKTPNTKI